MDAMITSEKLTEAGVAEPQAKAHARAHQETLNEAKKYANEITEEARKELATKGDLADLRVTLREDIAKLREDNAQLRLEMADRETRMMRFTVGAMIGGMTVLTAIFGIFVAPAIQALS